MDEFRYLNFNEKDINSYQLTSVNFRSLAKIDSLKSIPFVYCKDFI